MSTILLIDDDVNLCGSIKGLLTRHAFNVLISHDSKDAEIKIKTLHIDLILLDLLLPGDKDGMALCQSIRKYSSVPIIVLSAVQEETEHIILLEIGADFFLTKPFNSRILLAHIRAILRRSQLFPSIEKPVDIEHQVYEFVGWKLNITTRILLSADLKLVKLTASELALLQVFLERPQRVLSRDQLLDLTAHAESYVFDRSIDILMSRLRAKVEKKACVKIFTTIRNSGYMISCKVTRISIDSAAWAALLGRIEQGGSYENRS